ncbi:hypothetical protein QUF72_18700 [Desulfobacterales bacterium HSG2]|nr:hypothetical protein [Desulfobacterales bacterium HSG2]
MLILALKCGYNRFFEAKKDVMEQEQIKTNGKSEPALCCQARMASDPPMSQKRTSAQICQKSSSPDAVAVQSQKKSTAL